MMIRHAFLPGLLLALTMIVPQGQLRAQSEPPGKTQHISEEEISHRQAHVLGRLKRLNHEKLLMTLKNLDIDRPDGFLGCLCGTYSIAGSGIRYQPEPAGDCQNTMPCKGGNWGCVSHDLPTDPAAWEKCAASSAITLPPDLEGKQETIALPALIERKLRFRTAYRPCPEADFFYDGETLYNFYTGKPSLAQDRASLISDFKAMAVQWELETGKETTLGSSPIDAPFIAQSFDSGALPTGQEAALHQCARDMAATKKARLSPAEFFYCALKVSDGNIDKALITAHAGLYRDPKQTNARLIADYLEPIRKAEAYSDQRTIKVWNAQKGVYQEVSAKETASYDQQGAWYHLFGMMALEMADRQSLVPFIAVQKAVEKYKPTHATALAGGFPESPDCGALSNYAVALENQVRSNMRRAPDPDKQCVNYNGCAAGRALHEWHVQRYPPKVPGTIEPAIKPIVRPER